MRRTFPIVLLLAVTGVATARPRPFSVSAIPPETIVGANEAQEGPDVRAPVADAKAASGVGPAPAAIGIPMRVCVVDERGAAVAGAHVQVSIAGPRGSVSPVSATTDVAGTATFDSAGCVRATVEVRPAVGDDAHGAVEVALDPCVSFVAVALPKRHVLHLTVVDQDFRPVTSIERMAVESKSRSGLPTEAHASSPTGEYAVDVGADAGEVSLWSARGGATKYAYDPSSASTMAARVVLERAGVLQVSTRRDGSVVAGVHVALGYRIPRDCGRIEQVLANRIGPIGSRGDRYFAEQTSDAEGRVEFAIERFGDYVVLADSTAAGTGTVVVSVRRPERGEAVVIDLVDGAELEMRLLDARNEPAAGASVTLFGPGGVRRSVTAGEDGSCRARSLPPGSWTLAASLPNRRDRKVREGTVVEVALGSTARVDVPAESRARLAVETSQSDVDLYRPGCPPVGIEPMRRAGGGSVRFESDHVGPHSLVVRDARGEVVQIHELDLVEGDNTLRAELAPRESTLELVASRAFESREHYLRTTTHSGVRAFHRFGHGRACTDPADQGAWTWTTAVPVGTGDLVRVDPRSGEVEVVRADLVFERGVARRVVLGTGR